MRGSLQSQDTALAEACLAWWALAGVDSAVAEAPVDWLATVPARRASPLASAPAAFTAAPEPAPIAISTPTPATLDAFIAWLAEPDQPDAQWPGAHLPPVGPANAPLMVITDMPEPDDGAAGTLLSGKPGILFDAMLSAIGLTREAVFIAPLACRRPAGGMMETQLLDRLAHRMRALIPLVAPQRVLLMGDRTGRALCPTDGDGGPDALPRLNHQGGTVAAIATFHPRLLLGQPLAKAECWKSLQRLIEEPAA